MRSVSEYVKSMSLRLASGPYLFPRPAVPADDARGLIDSAARIFSTADLASAVA
jgi:hypothetical protein